MEKWEIERLAPGIHKLIITGNYTEELELEDCYLIRGFCGGYATQNLQGKRQGSILGIGQVRDIFTILEVWYMNFRFLPKNRIKSAMY